MKTNNAMIMIPAICTTQVDCKYYRGTPDGCYYRAKGGHCTCGSASRESLRDFVKRYTKQSEFITMHLSNDIGLFAKDKDNEPGLIRKSMDDAYNKVLEEENNKVVEEFKNDINDLKRVLELSSQTEELLRKLERKYKNEK